jgi:hypothetical protein
MYGQRVRQSGCICVDKHRTYATRIVSYRMSVLFRIEMPHGFMLGCGQNVGVSPAWKVRDHTVFYRLIIFFVYWFIRCLFNVTFNSPSSVASSDKMNNEY